MAFCATSFIIVVCGILVLCPSEVDAAPIHKMYSMMDVGKQGPNRLWGSDKDDSYREESMSRESSEDLSGILHSSLSQNAAASGDSYPSPHGKGTGWRFDLRQTVQADRSLLNNAGQSTRLLNK